VRVTEYVKKQKEAWVRRANMKAQEYIVREITTLQIYKKLRFSTEAMRIPVRVLEKTVKVS
jgi:hypothetical protein